MQKIGDKIVYNTIEEILDPSHTALVVWDVLRVLAKIIFNKEEFSSNLNSIVELARKLYTYHCKIFQGFQSLLITSLAYTLNLMFLL